MTQMRSSAAITQPNRSTAVAQQNAEPHGSLGDFPTPPWATRACLRHPLVQGWIGSEMLAREPAANRGHMVRPLTEVFARVDASDIHCYGAGFRQNDYLFGPDPDTVDWTITNPPFQLAEQFIMRALATSRVGVAMIVRSAFLEGQDRYESLYSKTPPTLVLQFAERVAMHKGHLPNPNIAVPVENAKTGLVVMKKPTTATAYAWLVWLQRSSQVRSNIDWIAPCRLALERLGDYPADGLACIGGAV